MGKKLSSFLPCAEAWEALHVTSSRSFVCPVSPVCCWCMPACLRRFLKPFCDFTYGVFLLMGFFKAREARIPLSAVDGQGGVDPASFAPVLPTPEVRARHAFPTRARLLSFSLFRRSFFFSSFWSTQSIIHHCAFVRTYVRACVRAWFDFRVSESKWRWFLLRASCTSVSECPVSCLRYLVALLLSCISEKIRLRSDGGREQWSS